MITKSINFVLLHPELTKDQKKVNARNMTLFFNSIASIENFESNLTIISQNGEGSVGLEFSQLFIQFIHNRLDKLITPEQIFTEKWDDVQEELCNIIGKETKKNKKKDLQYRADIASTLALRIVNYSLFRGEQENVKDQFIDRIKDIFKSEIFTKDLSFMMIRNIYNGNPQKFRKLTMDQDLIKIILV